MKGYRVIFGPFHPGELGGAEVIGFLGSGEPGLRQTPRYDPAKRRRNKRRRQAIKAQRRRGRR